MKTYLITFLAGFVFLVNAGQTCVRAETIAVIREDIETEFGTYHPNSENVIPSAKSYDVEEDLSNVEFVEYPFTDLQLELLKDNYFVVIPCGYQYYYGEGNDWSKRLREFSEIYKECADDNIPVLVTSDAVLHSFHKLYDEILKDIEIARFIDNLDQLNKAMVTRTEYMYASSSQDSVLSAIRKNLAFFSVAAFLTDTAFDIPSAAEELAHEELTLIEEHTGFNLSPIFRFPEELHVSPELDYQEDYSQYVARGHYTESESLSAYFKSMMWYGRMGFRVEPDCAGIEELEEIFRGKGIEETFQAILAVKALSEIEVSGKTGLDIWQEIYDTTVFFVGKADDLTVNEYSNLIAQIYGDNWLDLSVDELYNKTKLLDFIGEAKELRSPLINSSWVLDVQDAEKATKAFRFMGQRFVPDLYMFQQLVYVNVGYFYQSETVTERTGCYVSSGIPESVRVSHRSVQRGPVRKISRTDGQAES